MHQPVGFSFATRAWAEGSTDGGSRATVAFLCVLCALGLLRASLSKGDAWTQVGAGAMSEYQYYEFRAVDAPLTAKQMRELRAISTRAEITPTRFTNEYHW